MVQPAWRALPDGDGDGYMLKVRVAPNASRDAIEGVGHHGAGDAYLAVRVRAVPEKGKANASAEALIAKALGLPKSAMTVEKGETQRLKTVRIKAGAEIEAPLRAL
jgi:uncharacterized protein (TIGR00251 family)